MAAGGKTALIVAYFGKYPEFMDLFMKGCEFNIDIDFIFFTDWDWQNRKSPSNVKTYPFSLKQFNELATKKCGVEIKVQDGYKLCDLKPAWPHIFEDYLNEYEFVGYCDIDLIFGHIGKYFNEEVKKVADIFTITENYMSGALSIFRNIDKVKNLYKEGYGWQFIFQSPYHFAYDEFLRIDDRAMIGYAGDKRSLQSFSDVVKSFAKSNVIKLYNPEYIGFEQRPGLVTYDNGHVYQGGKEWIFFHYVIAKQSVTWTLPKWNDIPDKFYVNRYGFYRDTDKPLSLVNLLSDTTGAIKSR